MVSYGNRPIIVGSFRTCSTQLNFELCDCCSITRLYAVGLYENNSIDLWSSFFRENSSHFIHLGKFWSNRSILCLFIHSDPFGDVNSLPIIICSAFLLVVINVHWIPFLKQAKIIALPADPVELNDFQFPMGPTLSKDTLQEVYKGIFLYVPLISLLVSTIILFMIQVWVVILISASWPPSRYAGRFFRTLARRML